MKVRIRTVSALLVPFVIGCNKGLGRRAVLPRENRDARTARWFAALGVMTLGCTGTHTSEKSEAESNDSGTSETASSANPCAGVTCSGLVDCTVNGSTATCTCNAGFHASGRSCIADTTAPADPCAGVACSNNGTCAVNGQAASCSCNAGFHASGLTCVINSTSNSKRDQILSWLAGLSGNHVMIGQYKGAVPGDTTDTDAFVALTGRHVAVYGDGYWPGWPNTMAATTPAVNTNLVAHWNAGGLPYYNSFYPSPSGQDMYGTANPADVITPGTAQYNALFAMYDQEAAGLLALKAAGVTVLYRAYLECRWNFWWGFSGGSGWTDAQFIELWRQHHDYFVNMKGLDNLIWIYSQGFNAGDGSGHNTYPGDAYVDIVGEDVYSDNATDYQTWYSNELVQHPAKSWIMAEWGSGGPSLSTAGFDMRTLISDIKTSMPATVLFQAWTGHTQPYGWALSAMSHVTDIVADPYVLTLENLGRP